MMHGGLRDHARLPDIHKPLRQFVRLVYPAGCSRQFAAHDHGKGSDSLQAFDSDYQLPNPRPIPRLTGLLNGDSFLAGHSGSVSVAMILVWLG
jgi:hypothetical protein